MPRDPATLHTAFATTHPLDWGQARSAAEIAARHGRRATETSLRMLEAAAAVEPARTADLLASLPPGGTAHHLDHRVKSPESLARKLQNWQRTGITRPVDDVIRYTVLVQAPDELVAATSHTVQQLVDRGWRVRGAVHSYTDGSRYKGIHCHLEVPEGLRVEVQFHSAASMKVKDMTTPWYEIERSATATASERSAAREKCMRASDTLQAPAGIDQLTSLGGCRVHVANYSDSQKALVSEARGRAKQPDRAGPRTAAHQNNDGVAR
ncbi:RelA/SpoT domain-containing protein [Kribbella sandramycini]|uniref:RelA/SpoT domain-containing protein n=1 Tax=Kribbella sandramycini TaxID=60450 RepID=A0A7Y4P2N5_9ACTN|nr:RelA/SpoT domain-containing protein [Kribbella sandramycini]MBB6571301.1 hypothetical protein [Kribbella sandramycini]NOL43295.1 RelA/SpoT domain-containing protein [Kribbella sandramycini]